MTRLDRVLTLLDDYDALIDNVTDDYMKKLIAYKLDAMREEKEKLTQELIEHGCRRRIDRISQDIFSEKPAMQKQTWSGGW